MAKQVLPVNFLSIHDLTRRSTFSAFSNAFTIVSFNSRPHKAVDNVLSHIVILASVFQFTTSQGGRHGHRIVFQKSGIFQFTTSQGGRRDRDAEDVSSRRFQFTTSQGGRQCKLSLGLYSSCSFNSRPHKEVDLANPVWR